MAAGKVGLAGGKAAVGGAKVAAQATAGAAKTALVGSKGKVVTQAGGKFAGTVGKKTGLTGHILKGAKTAGGFVKGAVKQKVLGDPAKGAKVSKAAAAGRKTTKVIQGLQSAGGGDTGSTPAPRIDSEEAPRNKQQTKFTSRKIGGNPLHYDTHTKKVGKSPEPKRTVLQKPGANPTENKKKTLSSPKKKGSNSPSSSKVKAGITQVSLTKRDIGKNTKKIEPPVKIPEGSSMDRMSSKYTPEQMQQFAAERGIEIPEGALGRAGQAGQASQQGIPRPGNEQRPEGGFETPESRDVKEPLWSKLVSGVGKLAVAGAPPGVRDLVGSMLPENRYAKKQAKVDESRALILKMADKLDSPKEIKNFLSNPDFVEAFTQSVPGLKDKEDVTEYLTFAMDNDEIKPSELIGEQGFSSEPSEGSIPTQMGGQTVHLSPPSRVIPGGSRLYNEAQDKTLLQTEKAQEFKAFSKAMKEEDKSITDLEIFFAHAALNVGRYSTKVVGNKLVTTDDFTGEQTVIKSDNKTVIRTAPMQGDFGFPIGILFYNSNTLDPETGEVEIFQKLYFKDIGKKDGTVLTDEGGAVFTDEEIANPKFYAKIEDAWLRGGKGKKSKEEKEKKLVDEFIGE